MNIEKLNQANKLVENITEFEQAKLSLENLLQNYNESPGSVACIKMYYGNGKNQEAEVLFGIECIKKSIDEYQKLIDYTKQELENL